MEGARDVEVLRRPGSPQLEAQRVRGSWRDYLDPVEPSELADGTDEGSPHELGDFEPFSDTCGEYEDEDTEEELEGLDLALFEPGGYRRGPCCCSCPHHRDVRAAAGFLVMLVERVPKGKFWLSWHTGVQITHKL